MLRPVSATLLLALLVALTGGCHGSGRPIDAACPVCLDHFDPAAEPLDAPPGLVPNLAPVGPVRTVLNPDAHQRPIALAECITLALENGRTDVGNIRVLAFDPAIAATDIENSLAKFDAQLVTSMQWATVDQPRADPLQTVLDPRFAFLQEERATFSSALVKPLPTGGLAGITFDTNYLLTDEVSQLNPSYRMSLRAVFEQPLLRGAGVNMNQLRDTFPGPGVLLPYTQESTTPGILLTRVNADRSKLQFEQRLQDLLLAVEQAYWNLYLRYWNLYASETVLRQSLLAWRQAQQRFEAGQITIQDLSQLEVQYQLFRRQRLLALGGAFGQQGVLEAERVLRLTIGLPAEDGTQLVPSDTPTQAPYMPDWDTALANALASRPELRALMQDVKLAQLTLIRNRDAEQPDLRFFSSYDTNGASSRIDTPLGALASVGSNRFHDWTLGLRLYVPIGGRAASASVRRAELELQQNLAALRDRENVAAFELQRSYRMIPQMTELMRIEQARLRAAVTQLEARFLEFAHGQGFVFNLVDAQRTWANALTDYQSAVVAYNIALADFQRQMGTLPHYDNVTIAEGPLPRCAQERASEHIRERNAALILRQREAPPSSAESMPLRPSEARPITALLDELEHEPTPESLPELKK